MLPAVVVITRDRRAETASHVALADAVLVPIGYYQSKPMLAEKGSGYVKGTVLFHGVKPNELKVEVVVGKRLTGRCDKALYIEYFSLTFVGSTKSTAYVFA